MLLQPKSRDLIDVPERQKAKNFNDVNKEYTPT